MLKVSFKDNFKKVQTFNETATVVTLTGRVKIPLWWRLIPASIEAWAWNHPSVDFEDNYQELIIKVSGKSVCSEHDTFDPVLGERIAESRAKIRLYKFMHTLCTKILLNYYSLIYGTPNGNEDHTAVIFDTHGGLQEECMKYSTLWLKESQHLEKLIAEA